MPATFETDLAAAFTPLSRIVDLASTFAFAGSGAVVAVKERLDLFGVLTIAFVAACAGSVLRDQLIGATPPAVIRDWRYLAVATTAGVFVFVSYSSFTRMKSGVELLDAVGLALGVVAGAQKALSAGINPPMAAMLGMLGGVGGGLARDVLVSRTPSILRTDLYAVSALFGASLAVAGRMMDLPPVTTTLGAAAACFALRLVSIRRNWRLPVSRLPSPDE